MEKSLKSATNGDTGEQIFMGSAKREHNSRYYREKQAMDQADLEETYPILLSDVETHRSI